MYTGILTYIHTHAKKERKEKRKKERKKKGHYLSLPPTRQDLTQGQKPEG